MKIYLVGGAVRDRLLSRPCNDKDYVVVGSTPEEMLQIGFKQVGNNFPVFLHPDTNEEYALARMEESTGNSHTDFKFNFGKHVTLLDDLFRRDLTINAIAYDPVSEKYIDPFKGLLDLHNKTLRHVSEHFQEDPLRVLRVARFASQLGDFKVHPDTLELMQKMSNRGDLDTLTSERIDKELRKALASKNPRIFFDILRDCNALSKVFPEVYALIGIPQPKQHHSEGDVYEHTMMALTSFEYSDSVSDDYIADLRFAILCHDFGKALTPKDLLPAHHKHEKNGVPLVEKFCNRLKVNSRAKKIALNTTEHHMRCHKVFDMTPQKILKLIKSTNGLRNYNDLSMFVIACFADATGRGDGKNKKYSQGKFLLKATWELRYMDIDDLQDKGLSGKLLGDAIHKKRLNLIKQIKKECLTV